MDLVIILILIVPLAGMLAATRWLTRQPAVLSRPRLAELLWVLPALAYVAWAAKLLIDTARDPTSHNLWPLEMATVLMIWLAYATVLRIVLWVAGLALPRGDRSAR